MGKNKKRNKQQPNANNQKTTAGGNAATSNNKNSSSSSTNKGSPQNDIRYPQFSAQQRRELNKLILQLLDATADCPPNQDWEQFVKTNRILQSIMEIEEPLRQVVCPDASVDVVDDSQYERLKNAMLFSYFAEVNGIKSNGVEIADFGGSLGLGLRVTQNIDAQQTVLTVPRKAIFSEELLAEDVRKLYAAFPSLTNFALAYTLIIEKMRGKESHWHPYIAILPKRYNTVLYYTVEQMQRLRGTTAYTSAMHQCRVIGRQFAAMYKSIYIRPEVNFIAAMGVLFTKHGLCYEQFRWAVSTVMTRQNLIPRTKQDDTEPPSLMSALIPYWDMANHKPGIITSYFDPAKDCMDCTAQEAYVPGDQFFIYYGNRSSADLLVHNGFVEPNNRNDYVIIKMGLSLSDPLTKQRGHLLDLLGMEHKAELRILPSPEYISGQLLAFVRVFNMNCEQLEHWCSNPERVSDLLHIDCALETDHESRTWHFLHQRLRLILGAFNASMSEADEIKQLEQLNGKLDDSIDSMLLQYRRLERLIITGALEYVAERCKA